MQTEHSTVAAAIERSSQQRKLAKQILEMQLFCSADALPLESLLRSLSKLGDFSLEWTGSLLKELAEEYTLRESAVEIVEIAGGYLMQTRSYLEAYLGHRDRRSSKLSNAQLETLAIVAHRQPTTKSQIEALRGVDSGYAIGSLVERGLIEVIGKAERPGRPSLYSTTALFLQQFGLSSITDLVNQTTATASESDENHNQKLEE